MLDHFPTLHDGEEVIQTIRAHWLTAVTPLVATFVVFLAPFFFLWPLFRLGLPGAGLFAALVVGSVSVAARAYYRWQRSALTLTTSRLILVEQRGFFDRRVIETPYRSVRDVSYRIHGFLETLFRYGTVTVQMSGGETAVHCERLPSPGRVQQLILQLKHHGDAIATAGRGPWWEDRIRSMSEGEQREFFERVRLVLGDARWAELFRSPEKPSRADAAAAPPFIAREKL